MVRNIIGEIRRIPGVGRATLFSTERSLRVWIDPEKLVGYNLTADDVTKAIKLRTRRSRPGAWRQPSRARQSASTLVLVKGQRTRPGISVRLCCARTPTL